MKSITLTLFLLSLTIPALAWDNDDVDQAWRSQNLDTLKVLAQGDSFAALYSHYRIALIAQQRGDKKLAKRSLKIVTDALENTYSTADEAALYYNCIGLSIGLKPWSATFAMKKANNALDFSESKLSNHAPTLVAKGVGLFNRPAFVGGDKVQALELFDEAIQLYQENEAWGYEDAWLWKVKALAENDNLEQAKLQRELLLSQFPDFVEARELTF